MKTITIVLLAIFLILAPTSSFGGPIPGTNAPGEALSDLESSSVVCGDADNSGSVDLGDVVFTVNYIFTAGPAPDPLLAGDQNCDGTVNLADCVYLVAYLYVPDSQAPCCFTDADYCPRNYTTSFDLVTALQMAKLANEAYEVGPGVDTTDVITDCWLGIKFIQTDPDFECNVPQIPGQEDTQLFLARDPWTGDLVVSFRGSGTMQDWISDAQYLDPVDWEFDDGTVVANAVHKGFFCAYMSVKDELKSELRKAIQKYSDPSTARIYFTGHSLGGALAILASLDLSSWLVDTEGYDRDNVIMYSLAAPRPMKSVLLGYYRQRVPNSYAIMEKTDAVPYLLPTYEHIDNVVQINSHLDAGGNVLQTRLDFVDGQEVGDCGPVNKLVPWSYDAGESHDRDTYITRLQKVVKTGLPTVSLEVNSGYLVLFWSGNVQGPCDLVTLCKNCPSVFDDINFLSGNWAYVVNGSNHQTLTPKSEGYQAAYVNSLGKVLAKSAPYVSKKPSKLTLKRLLLGNVEVAWKTNDEGLYDYVALYNQNPNTAGPTGYIVGKKHLVLPDASDTWKTFLPGAPLWVAYVTADALVGGNRRIVKVYGPLN